MRDAPGSLADYWPEVPAGDERAQPAPPLPVQVAVQHVADRVTVLAWQIGKQALGDLTRDSSQITSPEAVSPEASPSGAVTPEAAVV
jgi:hypothetical protein